MVVVGLVPRAACFAALMWACALVGAQGESSVVAQVTEVAQGAAIVANRTVGLCVLCHAVPGVPVTQSGTIGPSLSGVGARWSAQQLREHLVAPERLNPNTVMPSVSRVEGFTRVAPARRGQPLLTETQIDAVVAYLVTLK
jgi:L-cysteine S-thiosulfotransferase